MHSYSSYGAKPRKALDFPLLLPRGQPRQRITSVLWHKNYTLWFIVNTSSRINHDYSFSYSSRDAESCCRGLCSTQACYIAASHLAYDTSHDALSRHHPIVTRNPRCYFSNLPCDNEPRACLREAPAVVLIVVSISSTSTSTGSLCPPVLDPTTQV